MKKIPLFFALIFCSVFVCAADLKGIVRDQATLEPIIGAIVSIVDSPGSGVPTDAQGNFSLNSIPTTPFSIQVRLIGYRSRQIEINNLSKIEVLLEAEAIEIQSTTVVARRRQTNEASMITTLRQSNQVAVGLSSAQIAKGSDGNAGEAIRRIPGVSLIDDKFIVVRGLSQRYNNVWLNGGSVPSSEADGRAFSFDMLPSANIDNIVVIKSYSADLPGDFCGGFIKIATKGTPEQRSIQLSLSAGLNSQTQFRTARLGASAPSEWLGFDGSVRPLKGDFPTHLGQVSDPAKLNALYKGGFNNDWSVRTFLPGPEWKANLVWNARVGKKVGMVLSAHYQSTPKTVSDIANRRYGVWSATANTPTVEKEYTDQQYSHETRAGLMNNWILRATPSDRIEFRNLLNIVGRNRLTERSGLSLVSGEYAEKQTEFLYSSRLTYTGQLAGHHALGRDRSSTIDWNGTYSYAHRNEPDRRIVSNIGQVPADRVVTENTPTYNDKIQRYYQNLDDHAISGAMDYKKEFKNSSFRPTIKAGAYGEYRTRVYTPREFTYNYDNLAHDVRQAYIYKSYQEMMRPEWLGSDKVTIKETGYASNAYTGNQTVGAGYLSAILPVGKVTFDVGLRAELWNASLSYDRSMDPNNKLLTTHNYTEISLLPALNVAYAINEKQILRASYGRTVNRPELRELSPAVYYDFDLFAEVQGNPLLKMATIDNIDLRYEFYPSSGEMVSVGLFYKHFTNPIEWNFTDMGGTYRYSYENAKSAYAAGIEIEVRKHLDFIGIPELAIVLNGALVASEVQFDQTGLVTQKSRALQGQSPYLVNAGLYYTSNDKLGLSASVLYNIIGRRIVGIGRNSSIVPNSDYDLPDSYEMPRNLLDITVAKKFARRFEVKLGVKNALNEAVELKQFPTVTIDGVQQVREQTTRSYYPGVSASLSFSVKF